MLNVKESSKYHMKTEVVEVTANDYMSERYPEDYSITK